MNLKKQFDCINNRKSESVKVQHFFDAVCMRKDQCCVLLGTSFSAMDYQFKYRYWWIWCERQHSKLDQCPEWPCACTAFLFPPKFVFGFQCNPICRDFRSESRYWNKHNTSLHLWPPSSSSSLWMRGNNGGEQGRGRKIAALFRCLLKVHKLKDSTFNSGNKSVRKPTCKMLHTRLLQMEMILFITVKS